MANPNGNFTGKKYSPQQLETEREGEVIKVRHRNKQTCCIGRETQADNEQVWWIRLRNARPFTLFMQV